MTFSWPWYFGRLFTRCLGKCPSIWVCLMFTVIKATDFFGGIYIIVNVPFLTHYIRGHIVLICLITTNIDLDTMFKVGTCHNVQYKVTVFPLCYSTNILEETYWSFENISFIKLILEFLLILPMEIISVLF